MMVILGKTSAILITYFPYIALVFLLINLHEYLDSYAKLNKLKVGNRLQRYGHALTFTLQYLQVLASFCFMLFGFILIFFLESDSFIDIVLNILIFIAFLFIAWLPSMFLDGFFYDLVSDEAKLKRSYAEKLKSTAATITDNEKKELIQKLKQEYLADLKENFWKGRLIENKKL